jgi:hypothetical protein
MRTITSAEVARVVGNSRHIENNYGARGVVDQIDNVVERG